MKKLIFALLLLSTNAFAAITDLKLGFGQVWQIASLSDSGTTWTVRSKQFPTFYNGFSNFTFTAPWVQSQVAAGRYMQLVKNPGSNNVYNHSLVLRNSDGSLNSTISSSISVSRLGDGFMMMRVGAAGGWVDANGNQGGNMLPLVGISMNASFNIPDTTHTVFTNVNPTVPAAALLTSYIPASAEPIPAGTSVPIGTGVAGGGSAAPVYSSNMTTAQANMLNTANTKTNAVTLGNKIYLEEKPGTSNTTVNIDQQGRFNIIRGTDGGNAPISGVGNTVNIRQGSNNANNKNLTEFSVNGNNNQLTVWQGRDRNTGLPAALDASQHYTTATINGSNNTLAIKQSNESAQTGVGTGHYNSTIISGSNNTMTVTQSDSVQKTFFGFINGNNSTLNATQSGGGTKYLDIQLNGGGHYAVINQTGNGAHKATISLTNNGGASTLILTQQNATPQVYSINQSCATAAGCAVSLNQGQ